MNRLRVILLIDGVLDLIYKILPAFDFLLQPIHVAVVRAIRVRVLVLLFANDWELLVRVGIIENAFFGAAGFLATLACRDGTAVRTAVRVAEE